MKWRWCFKESSRSVWISASARGFLWCRQNYLTHRIPNVNIYIKFDGSYLIGDWENNKKKKVPQPKSCPQRATKVKSSTRWYLVDRRAVSVQAARGGETVRPLLGGVHLLLWNATVRLPGVHVLRRGDGRRQCLPSVHRYVHKNQRQKFCWGVTFSEDSILWSTSR